MKYKNFYAATQNNYPEFSICLLKNSINQFNESKLPYNISSADLGRMLNGDEPNGQDATTTRRALQKLLEELSTQDNVSYEDLLMDDLKNVIKMHLMITMLPVENEKNEFQGNSIQTIGSETEGETHFKKSLETNICRCWTRHFTYVPGQIIITEGVSISSGTMFKGYFRNLLVTIHKKGQLIRSVMTSIRVDDTMNLKVSWGKLPAFAITMNQIKLITRRYNAEDKCDPNLLNDDEKMLQTSSKMLGCIPIFWKEVSKSWKDFSNISYCKDPNIYKIHHTNHWQFPLVYKNYLPPCAKFSVTYDISTIEDDEFTREFTGDGDLVVKIMYRTEEYEEITNLRKFDAESLFSQVGGLIGIMIGASFFNIPDILLNMVSKFETTFKRIFFTTQLNRTESGSLIAKPFANTVSKC